MIERREYFRIRDRLELEFREIDKQEFIALEHEIKYKPSQLDGLNSRIKYGEEVPKCDDEKELLVPYLRWIDRKVSAILDLLSRSAHDLRSSQTKPFTAWYGEVHISGAGLSFDLPAPIHEQTLLHLKVMLPIFPYPAIHTLCQAVRKQETQYEGSTVWKNALKFLVINDMDRDLLISYIFDKEREQIRLHKALENG